MYSTKDILLQVLRETSEQNKSFGKTRLIKFLYLVEVEYYREMGQRITDLNWLFYYYGPYALELDAVFSEREFEKKEIKSQDDKDVILFKVAESVASYAHKIDVKISLLIKKIVGYWKDKPLEELLDYVYFETEPMQTVEKRGDVLDFTTIKKENAQVVIPLKASKETETKVAELRKRLAPTLKRLAEQRVTERNVGKEYQEAIEAWDEDMRKDFDPEVLKKITITITRPTYDSGKEGN